MCEGSRCVGVGDVRGGGMGNKTRNKTTHTQKAGDRKRGVMDKVMYAS